MLQEIFFQLSNYILKGKMNCCIFSLSKIKFNPERNLRTNNQSFKIINLFGVLLCFGDFVAEYFATKTRKH
jgi:hypothetical protein